MRMRQKWILAFVVVAFLGCAGALPAVGQECARLTDGHRSLVPRPDSAPQGPVCREPDPVSLAVFKTVDGEPVPSESVCNCDSDSDCKAICGDRGGSCQALLACPVPPYRHKG